MPRSPQSPRSHGARRRRRIVESILVSRHHLGLSCVANAFTLSATLLRLCCEDEDEDDEEGEDDERAEGQGRGRMLGMKGVCTPCVEAERGGPSLSALSIQRARSAISAISIQRASKKVERSDHGGLTRGERARLARCALHAVELQRRSGAPGGHAPWARGLPAGLPQRHSRSLRSEKESCTLHGACV
jgi:hypothetical protein